jgi:hypothetical protein
VSEDEGDTSRLLIYDTKTQARHVVLEGRELGDTTWIDAKTIAVDSGIFADSGLPKDRVARAKVGVLVVRVRLN